MQTSSQILLIQPASFGYNEQTSLSNTFQNKVDHDGNAATALAVEEFKLFAEQLRKNEIDIFVFEDSTNTVKPDAVFPNNWISMHEDGKVILYPMCAPNRRIERNNDLIEQIKRMFIVNEVIDLTRYENENRFLEGTGSIVFDHDKKKAYACISPRTYEQVLNEVCKLLNYQPVIFHSQDENDIPVYHTNVMMCIAGEFAVICLESIANKEERKMVSQSLRDSNHEIIDISFEQVKSFAGNMLAIHNRHSEKFLAMSQSAFDSLNENQKKVLEKYCTLLPLNVKTIENVGGGSARCMMAEIFLQKR